MKHQIKAKLQVEWEEAKGWPFFSYMKELGGLQN